MALLPIAGDLGVLLVVSWVNHLQIASDSAELDEEGFLTPHHLVGGVQAVTAEVDLVVPGGVFGFYSLMKSTMTG